MFDAAEAVPALAYKFSTAPDPAIAAIGDGIVPEPSEGALQAFADALSAAENRLLPLRAAIKSGDDEAIRAASAELASSREEANQEVRQAVADLCNGSPTRAQLDALPPRLFNAFVSYLVQELLAPKG